MKNYQLGEIVISTAGRDANRYFIVVELVNDKFIKIADGDLRQIEEPKLKNIKHVTRTGDINHDLAEWLNEDRRVKNEDLKSILEDYEQQKGA